MAQVKVEPKYTKEITIDRDDFILRTDKDGDRTKPMAPSQIAEPWLAGADRHAGPGRAGRRTQSRLEYGRAIGMGGGGIGAGGGADTSGVKATMENSDKENPLKKTARCQGAAGKEDRRAGDRFPFLPDGKPEDQRSGNALRRQGKSRPHAI